MTKAELIKKYEKDLEFMRRHHDSTVGPNLCREILKDLRAMKG